MAFTPTLEHRMQHQSLVLVPLLPSTALEALLCELATKYAKCLQDCTNCSLFPVSKPSSYTLLLNACRSGMRRWLLAKPVFVGRLVFSHVFGVEGQSKCLSLSLNNGINGSGEKGATKKFKISRRATFSPAHSPTISSKYLSPLLSVQ